MSVSAEYHSFHNLRERLEKETNSFNIKPISFDIFKKDEAERGNLKIAKSNYRALMENRVLFNQTKNEILQAIIDSKVPEWGDIKLRI